jgi:hypothetical protein
MRFCIGGRLHALLLRSGLALLCVVVSLPGCINIQKDTITKGRFKYTEALRDSWEEQMLFNIVSLRYAEVTAFLDVESLITQYGLETSAGFLGGRGNRGTDTYLGNLGGAWSERPTITYAPVEGREFAYSMLRPMSPSEVFALINAGWNAERSLRLIVKSVNGVYAIDPATRELQPEFLEILQSFKQLQDAGALGIRQDFSEEGVRTFIYLREGNEQARVQQASSVLADSLRIGEEYTAQALDPSRGLEVQFGPYIGDPAAIVLQTHSVMDILVDTASFIDVPQEHVDEQRTMPNRYSETLDTPARPPIRILSSVEEPADATVSVYDRDYWYYIDDRDLESKKAFSFLMILLQLQASREAGKGPVITIGTGN